MRRARETGGLSQEVESVCVLLPLDQRPHLTSKYRGTDPASVLQTSTPFCHIPAGRQRICSMEEGGRKNRKRFVCTGVIRETQRVFPSPAESKGLSLLGEWLTLFSWFESCFQEPPQSSPRLPHCSSQSDKFTGSATDVPYDAGCHPQLTPGDTAS